VSSPAEAREHVRREIADTSPEFVKVAVDSCGGVGLRPEIVAAVVDEAHRLGKRVLVHPGTVEDAMLAMQMGADMLMHAPSCGQLSDVQRATLSLRHIPTVTTLRAHGVLARMFVEPLPLTAFERRVMRPGAEKGYLTKGDLSKYPKLPKDYAAQMAARTNDAFHNIKALMDGGAVVLAGSDSGLPGLFHGAALHEELVGMVHGLGISPAAALQMATYFPGRYLSADGILGVIEVGAWADLVLVDGDPTKNIEATKDIVGVWQRGRRVARRDEAR
jgi:imidazolonepropionase-like amidohydrolase